MYVDDLKQKLLKDNLWMDKIFDTINREAYHGALRTLPCAHQISIAKLSHQLWQTKVRNHRFYQQSDKCPLCQTVSETWTHVLSCDHLVAQEQRRATLSTLVTALKDKNTPPQVVESMVSGLSQWFSHPADQPLPPYHRCPHQTTNTPYSSLSESVRYWLVFPLARSSLYPLGGQRLKLLIPLPRRKSIPPQLL